MLKVKKYKRQNKKTRGGGDKIKELRYRLGVHLQKIDGKSLKQTP
jgi:hypothetical protein